MKQKPKSGSGEASRGKSARILQHVLADEYLLSTATRDYYRNVAGGNVQGLKRVFALQLRQAEAWLAKVARRVSFAGSLARGSLNHLARFARISAPAGAGLALRTMIAELHALHEGLARRLRMDVTLCSRRRQDAGTERFLRELLRFHDDTAGELRLLLEDPHKE